MSEDEPPPEIPLNLAGLAGSLMSLFAGVAFLLDDAQDFGKMGDDRGYPHHWLIGVLAMLGGLAGLGFSLLNLLSKTPPPPTPPKGLPPSLLEQGAPVELVEKYK